MFYLMHSGQKIYPLSISEDDICIEDIAHHLTNIQRFGGSLPFSMSYSVAEHSILLAQEFLLLGLYSHAAYALLHDATEAYLGDVITALKQTLPDYRRIENDLHEVIINKFGLYKPCEELVKEYDTRILLNEVRDLMPDNLAIFEEIYPHLLPLDGVNITGKRSKQDIYGKYIALARALNMGE